MYFYRFSGNVKVRCILVFYLRNIITATSFPTPYWYDTRPPQIRKHKFCCFLQYISGIFNVKLKYKEKEVLEGTENIHELNKQPI